MHNLQTVLILQHILLVLLICWFTYFLIWFELFDCQCPCRASNILSACSGSYVPFWPLDWMKSSVLCNENTSRKVFIFLIQFSFNRYLGFDHAATLFHIRDSAADSVERPIYLTNTFGFAVLIHDVVLPEETKPMFKVSCISLKLST